MKSITKQKTIEEIERELSNLDKIFVVGCGTCTTLTKTGGIEQVEEMKTKLQEMGKRITGTTVIPTACDDMTAEAMKENESFIRSADCVLSLRFSSPTLSRPRWTRLSSRWPRCVTVPVVPGPVP